MDNLTKTLKQKANPQKAKIYQGFFKTGKDEYGEGDLFLGLSVPETRKIAKEFSNLSFDEIKKHLQSKYHEERLATLLILVHNYKKANDKEKEKIINFYLSNTEYINNWDLVDLSADKILGNYLLNKNKSILYKLAGSNDLWEKRISIISTFEFIKNNRFEDAFKISQMLLKDKHDLIHKAVGWMLREVGKRNQGLLENFLNNNYKHMPRTTLRYAV